MSLSDLVTQKGSEADIHVLAAAAAGGYEYYKDFGPEDVTEFMYHPVWLALRQRIAASINSAYNRIDEMDNATPDREVHVARGVIKGLKWMLGEPGAIISEIEHDKAQEKREEDINTSKIQEKALRDILGY